MKRFKQMIVGAALLALLGAAGCAGVKQNAANGQQPGQGQMNGTFGVITKVSANSITVAVMPAGSGPRGDRGNGQQGQPNASGAPQQPPADGSGKPAPNASGAPDMAAPDTSSWEKQTFAIAGDTVITQGRSPNSNASSAQKLAAADLKAGDSVRITAKSGDAKTAAEISVMGGGFGGGQGGPGGNAPAATATNKA